MMYDDSLFDSFLFTINKSFNWILMENHKYCLEFSTLLVDNIYLFFRLPVV
jgi:hypothetical protein